MIQSTTAQSASAYTDLQGLNDLKTKAREDSDSVLRDVAEKFEAMFLEQIFKEARKTKLGEDIMGGQHVEFFQEMTDKQMAQELSAQGSLGIADKLVMELSTHHHMMTRAKLEQRG